MPGVPHGEQEEEAAGQRQHQLHSPQAGHQCGPAVRREDDHVDYDIDGDDDVDSGDYDEDVIYQYPLSVIYTGLSCPGLKLIN